MTLQSLFNHRLRQPMSAPPSTPPSMAPGGALGRLVAAMRFELVPVASIDTAIAALPRASAVTVTCLPGKGLGPTLELTTRLLDAGHRAVPHLAARLVEDRAHVARLASWLRTTSVREVFVVGGDAAAPVGRYADGSAMLRDLLEHDTGLRRIGVPAYPDGHPLIADEVLGTALRSKQALIAAAGVDGWATTQMCFDPDRIDRWLTDQRSNGLQLPVELGVPGVVERKRLMTMGVRLGVGASLRFLRKQRATMVAMLAPGGYDPTDLVATMSARADALGIEGLHAFTFNAVAATEAWRQSLLWSAASNSGGSSTENSRPSEPR